MTSMRPCSLTFACRGFAAATATATLSLAACPASTPDQTRPRGRALPRRAGDGRSEEDRRAVAERFEKMEVEIPMRDGRALHGYLHAEGCRGPLRCYSDAVRGGSLRGGRVPHPVGPSQEIMEDGYIFVYQDVRGRFMSEFINDASRARPGSTRARTRTTVDCS